MRLDSYGENYHECILMPSRSRCNRTMMIIVKQIGLGWERNLGRFDRFGVFEGIIVLTQCDRIDDLQPTVSKIDRWHI